jgi:signal transduction histidine kinase
MAEMDNRGKSTKAIASDSNEYTFRPRARVIRTLGQELISSETVALIELVKNAYDADATNVLIRFIGQLDKGRGSIEVIDNGHGMTMKTVLSAWMEPATNSKRTSTQSEGLKRNFLGEKGIGRFACSRLASELELITRRKSESQETYAFFDWTQFDNEKLYLDEVQILAEPRDPKEICPGGTIEAILANENNKKNINEGLKHGTILRMSKLTKTWIREDFAALQRDLSRLISPFEGLTDFNISLELPPEFFSFSSEIKPPEIIKYPHYSLKGVVHNNGSYRFTLRVYANGLTKEYLGRFLRGVDEDKPVMLMLTTDQAQELIDSLPEDEIDKRKIQTGPFEVELRIWDRDELGNVVQKTVSTLQDVRRDLDAVAGINIYRDGFRVLPYGEPHDDWLRLDMRRVQKPTMRLSNNQVVGFISIEANENPNLKDQSNREGLDENQALKDLREILLLLLNEIELVRYPLRPSRAKQPFSKPVQGLFSAAALDSLRNQFVAKYPDDEVTRQLVDDAQKSLEDQINEIQIVFGRYQRLAALGTLADVILHDGRHPLSVIIQQAVLGQEDIDDTKSITRSFLNGLQQRFNRIESQGNFLNTTFDKIEPFSGRRRGHPGQLYLEKIIENAVSVFHSEIKKLGVDIKLPKTETLMRVDQAEIQQIIVNLLQNSLYWLEYVEKDKRKIIITVDRIGVDHVEIIFADSGPGVSPAYREMIFEPYFSTKPDGVGLGLAIAGEIISDYYNGKLELLDSNLLPGAIFRITLKKRAK